MVLRCPYGIEMEFIPLVEDGEEAMACRDIYVECLWDTFSVKTSVRQGCSLISCCNGLDNEISYGWK